MTEWHEGEERKDSYVTSVADDMNKLLTITGTVGTALYLPR
jgi:hypothetical protein